MYNVNLEVFQGPLDLLLHLIEKMEIDIYNIPISELTESYLEYINSAEEFSLEIAEEYIVMAATLLHIKSKSLLPTFDEDEQESADEELVQQLLDYKNYKEISRQLEELQQERRLFLEKESFNFEQEINMKNLKISSNKLLKALENIIKTKNIEEQSTDVINYKEELSLVDVKNNVLEKINAVKKISFSSFITNYNKKQLVLVFISLLGMIKDEEIICQEEDGEIYIECVKEI